MSEGIFESGRGFLGVEAVPRFILFVEFGREGEP